MTSAQGLQTTVALKVLRRDLMPGSLAVQRLRDEGRLLARVRHPAIVVVHDLVELDGRVALVTEYVRGQDLEACIRGPDPIPLRAMLEVCAQVAGALEAAWSTPVGEDERPLRLAHRDVKPSNVRIGRHGEVKLLDFGIARTDELTREARTGTDMLVGSPPYMAPERFLDGDVRAASDVLAVGVMLAERLLGERLFDVPVPVMAGMAVVRGRYEAYIGDRLQGLDAPAEVVELVAATLAYDPELRPTALEVGRRCEQLADARSESSLVAWCRGRPWPTPAAMRGELEGQTLTEGTLAPAPPVELEPPPLVGVPGELVPGVPVSPEAARPLPPTPASVDPTLVTPRVRPSRAAWWLGGVSAVGGLGFVGLVLLSVGVVALVQWSPWQVAAAPALSDAPRPMPAGEGATEPEPSPVEADPVVEPEPVVRPEPEPAGVPAPEPREALVPPPPPAVSPTEPGVAGVPVALVVEGDVVAALLVDGAQVRLPATVPAGEWPLWASFNRGDWRSTDVVVEVDPGWPPTVRCGGDMERCVTE